MTVSNSSAEKFIIVPYRKNRQGLVPAEMCPASSAASAERIAELMSARFAGVAAYAVVVDEETGDMCDPRLLVKFGEVPDINAD